MMPSWSSEISSSASDTSMPRLSTPRMVPMPSVMFLPGMNVPGGENTLTRPARAFGAPTTTSTRQRPGLVLDVLDLKPDHGEPVSQLFQRLVGVEMLLEPGEGELHGCVP